MNFDPLETKTQQSKWGIDYAFLLSHADFNKLFNDDGSINKRWILSSQIDRELATPWHKEEMMAVQAFVPLLLHCQQGKPGAEIKEGMIIGLTTNEDRLPKIRAKVLKSNSDFTSRLEPIEVILTIGGTRDQPEYGILHVKNFHYNFRGHNNKIPFCREEDKRPAADEFPIVCSLGSYQGTPIETSHPEAKILETESAMPARTTPQVIAHDFTLHLSRGFPGSASDAISASKEIPANVFATDQFTGQNGFVLSVRSEEPCTLSDRSVVGFTFAGLQNEIAPPVTGARIVGDTEISSVPTHLLFTLGEGDTLQGQKVEVKAEMSLVNSEMLTTGMLGPKFEIPEVKDLYDVSEAIRASVQKTPILSANFALFAVNIPVSAEALQGILSPEGKFLIAIHNPASNTLYGTLALMEGKNHLMSISVPETLPIVNGTLLEVTVSEEGIFAGLANGGSGNATKFDCPTIYKNDKVS